jgi:hypothetical protein
MQSTNMPISFAQQHLLLLEQMQLTGPTGNPGATLRLHGDLDVQLLERSFTDLVRRHESLRTCFAVIDGEGVQIVGPPSAFRVELSELRAVEPAVREQLVMALERRHRERAFDLARGPLLRVYLLRLQNTEHVLQIIMHQMISDDWSLEILLHELGALYSAYKQGGVADLAPLEWQYADYAQWQRECLQGPPLQRHLAYWKEHLCSTPHDTELPTDRSRSARQNYRGAVHRFEWSMQMSRNLHEMSRSHGVTVFMLLLGALQVVLGRWSRQDDVVVGTAVAGRTRSEMMGLIGLLVSSLPLRTNLSGDPEVGQLLGRIRKTTSGAYAHQELPFGKLIAELRPPFDRRRMPVFQVMLTEDAVPPCTLDAAGVTVSRESVDCATAHFDLTVHFVQTLSRMQGRIEYAADLYVAATIERFTCELQQVLEQMIERPAARLSELSVRGRLQTQ